METMEINEAVDVQVKETSKASLKERISSCFKPFFSLAISAFGVFVMQCCSAMIKKFDHISIFVFLATRFALMFLISLAIVIYRKQPLFPKGKRVRLIARSFLGSAGITIGNCALRHMPMGDKNMIGSTAMFFVCISAWIFLKEPIDKLNMINILIIIGGIVFIVQPPFIFQNDYLLYSEDRYALYAAIAAIAHAILIEPNTMVILRSLKDVPFATILLTYGAIGFINGVILVLIFDVYYGTGEVMGSFPTTLYEWFIIVSIGILTYVGPASLTIGLQIEMAGLLSLMRKAFAIIFSYTFQITLFGETPNAIGIIGALMISFAILLSGVKKVLDEKLESEHPIKSKYCNVFFSKPSTPTKV